MIRFKGRLEYVGGEAVEFTAGNAALAVWERYAVRNGLPMGKESPPLLSSLVIAHHALGIEQGIDAWIETVDGIELEAEGGEVPPTNADPSTV